jgi:probable rRNA maturation factor
VLDLTVDRQVAALLPAPWRRRLRVEVARMITAAARDEGRPELEVALRLTDDEAIQALNRGYRKKDKATDVLAFAQREGPLGRVQPQLLGDVVIALPTARRQAKVPGARGLFVEVRFLAAHGLCHLLGYDHRTDAEEREMNARMAALLTEGERRGRIAPA